MDSFDFMPPRPSGSISVPQRVTPESDDGEETEDETGDGLKGNAHSHVGEVIFEISAFSSDT